MAVELVNEAWPFVTAALGAYGANVLTRVQDQAAEDTANWGRRILQRVFGTRPADETPPPAIDRAAADLGDSQSQDALRGRIGELLEADPELATEVRAMVHQAGQIASGQGQVNAQSYDNSQQNNQGQGAFQVTNIVRPER
ncbi:hypothetical protein ACFU44_24075 [Nocardia rhizosphaerihabitans]|uniref:hypothetical protein n=1 Tax=Nocardia rhizosphaerihabitans TaxID=1691570 RepID=UPI00366FB9E4